MWPGSPSASARTWRTRASTATSPANRHGRVEVALQRVVGTDPAARLRQRHAEVDADDVGARVAHVGEQLARPDAEVDLRDTEVRDVGERTGRVRQDVLAVVARGQRADPGVEELDGARAGQDLLAEELARDRGQLLQQRVPHVGSAVHQRLGVGVVAARTALDEVGRERERRAGEADERRRAELVGQRGHGREHRRDVVRREVAQPVDVGQRCGTARRRPGRRRGRCRGRRRWP